MKRKKRAKWKKKTTERKNKALQGKIKHCKEKKARLLQLSMQEEKCSSTRTIF